MTISGMSKKKSQMREESKKNAKKFSRDNRVVLKTKRKSPPKSAPKFNKKIILSFLSIFSVLIIGVLFYNWRDVQSYLDALNISDPVNSVVIPKQENSDGLERVVLITSKYDERGDKQIDRVYSLSSNKEKGTRSIIYIPGGVYIPLGYREFSDTTAVNNLYYAGETISQDLGVTYSIWEIENFLGYEFDHYIWLDPEAVDKFESSKDIKEDIDAEKYLNKLVKMSNPINMIIQRDELAEMVENIYSDLTFSQILDRLSKYSFNAFDEVLFADFSNSEFINMEIVASGNEAPVLDKGVVDDQISTIASEILSKDIEREQSKVEIYNGSEISGMASRYGRKVLNNGINVVRVDNTDYIEQQTTIYVPKEEMFVNSIELLSGLLPVEPRIISDRPTFLTTSDIVVILGEDLKEEVGWLPGSN